jgi:hypothetical protein
MIRCFAELPRTLNPEDTMARVLVIGGTRYLGLELTPMADGLPAGASLTADRDYPPGTRRNRWGTRFGPGPTSSSPLIVTSIP